MRVSQQTIYGEEKEKGGEEERRKRRELCGRPDISPSGWIHREPSIGFLPIEV